MLGVSGKEGGLTRSVLSNWAAVISIGAISFLLTPVLIHHLGDFYYGMWVVASSLMDYYGLTDLGMRPTLQRFVGRLSGRGEREGLDETLSTAMAVSVAVGVLPVALTIVLIVVVPGFLSLSGPAREVGRWLILLLGLSMTVQLPAGVVRAYLCGLQRFDLCNVSAVGLLLVRALVIVAVLKAGFGVLAVGLVALAFSGVTIVASALVLRIADRGVKLQWRKVRSDRARSLARFGIYAFLNSLGDYVRFYSYSFIVGRLLGVSLVTPFSVAARLMGYFRTVLLGLVNPLMSRLSELEGQRREREIGEVFLNGTRAAALASLFLGLLVMLDGRALLRLWLGERLVGAYPVALILTLGYVVNLSQYPCNMVMYAKGRHQVLGVWCMIEAVANVCLSAGLGRRYGLVGVAWGNTIPMLCTGVLMQPCYGVRLTGVGLGRYVVVAFGRPLLASGAFVILNQWLSLGRAAESLSGFGMIVAVQAALFGLLTYAFGLSCRERAGVWSYASWIVWGRRREPREDNVRLCLRG